MEHESSLEGLLLAQAQPEPEGESPAGEGAQAAPEGATGEGAQDTPESPAGEGTQAAPEGAAAEGATAEGAQTVPESAAAEGAQVAIEQPPPPPAAQGGDLTLYLIIGIVAALLLLGVWLRGQRRARPLPADPEVDTPPSAVKKATSAQPAPQLEASGRTLREGLARTHDGFIKRLGAALGGAKSIDDALLGQIEEILFTADIGVRTSQKLVEGLQEALSKQALKQPDKVFAYLKEEMAQLLVSQGQPLQLDAHKPLVILVVGVNGAGKTTSIGKLASRFKSEGKSVLLAAADTFRAAAVEQLMVWGERAGVEVVRGKEGQDPSSVVFEAIERASREGYDICIADTAGRLQAKKELMDELAKVSRVAHKALPGAPHEVWLVLDATNGQNAISQAKLFTEAAPVTGIVLTKLDGTAKGGVVIGISDEMKIPVRFIGIGEKVEDLRPFDAEAFTEALFQED